MKTYTHILAQAIGLVSALGLMGCGSNSSNNNNSSAIPSGYNGSSMYITQNNGAAESLCSGASFNTSAGTFSAQSQIYFSNGVNGQTVANSGVSQTGAFNYNEIRVRIKGVPSDFSATTGAVAFYSYSLDASGNMVGETPVPFFIENYTGSNSFSISNSSSTSTMTSYSLSGQSLASVDFVLVLPNPNATVINVALYPSAGSNATASHNLQMLVPGYYANPNTYQAAPAHSAALSAMHPLISYLTSGYTDAQYASMMTQYCF
jgi:hypothetical protein